jgi:hypothetical protein
MRQRTFVALPADRRSLARRRPCRTNHKFCVTSGRPCSRSSKQARRDLGRNLRVLRRLSACPPATGFSRTRNAPL